MTAIEIRETISDGWRAALGIWQMNCLPPPLRLAFCQAEETLTRNPSASYFYDEYLLSANDLLAAH
jgi:hypothetical protein